MFARYIKYILSFALLLLLQPKMNAQDHPMLAYFNGIVENNTLVLKWAVQNGQTCSGIKIHHSLDDSIYTEVGDIPGICGDIIVSIAYTFEHKDAASHQRNYYKLELGKDGFSTPLAVDFYPVNTNGFKLFPNPASEEISFYIEGKGEEISVQILSMQGQMLRILSGRMGFLYIPIQKYPL